MNEAELHRFNQFEEVEVRDTYTIASMEQARKLEAFLNAKPYEELTELERLELKMYANDYIEAMNNACPYRGDRVLVSGEVTKGSYDEVGGEYSTLAGTHSNQQVIAKGYNVLLKQDDDGRSRYIVGHYFLTDILEPRAIGLPLVDHVPRLYSFAPVGSVDIVSDVLERGEAGTLSQIIPDVIERINDRVNQAKNAADALRSLHDIVIQEVHDMPEEVTNDLRNYTYDLLGLDEVVPYVVQLRGAVYQGELANDGTLRFEYYDNDSDELLVSPIELRLAQYPTKVEEGYQLDNYDHFVVRLKVYGNTNDEGERTILVPVRNIKRMLSLRELASMQWLTKREK